MTAAKWMLPLASTLLLVLLLHFSGMNKNLSLLQLEMSPNKPNFVLVLVDDLAWNSIGSTSDLSFLTPFLSNISDKGLSFNQHYAQEVCTPSRASLLTGRYPLSMGMQYRMVSATMEWGMDIDEVTLADVLQSNGYRTHIFGKWHLGHFSPLFLPTARGFDSYLGFVNGETFYFSKHNPDYPKYFDFIEANSTCYAPYDDEDKHTYSTHILANHTKSLISKTGDESSPFFFYLAFQAVHGPFSDVGHDSSEQGIPDEYLPKDILRKIHSRIMGKRRREYAKSLFLLDQSIEDIYTSLDEASQLDSTYIIVMSDNGGCVYGGSSNFPLRGMKGSLFEGGTKVDAFVYSPMLSGAARRNRQRRLGSKEALDGSPVEDSSTQSTEATDDPIVYTGLMHISDWFPTMLGLASIDYSPSDPSRPLDGVDHSQVIAAALRGEDVSERYPRDHVLYNMYVNVTGYDFDVWNSGGFAVRNSRYKLLHTYDDALYGGWISSLITAEGSETASDEGVVTADDAEFDDGNLEWREDEECMQTFLEGNFSYFLFDLDKDPHETTNLYASTEAEHEAAKAELYALVEMYRANARQEPKLLHSKRAKAAWTSADFNILPWANLSTEINAISKGKVGPKLCIP